MPTNPYTRDFYKFEAAGSRQSAEVIVPLVLELVPARSVVDVGCGIGTWLAAFENHGVKEILGVDGDYVDQQQLQIPSDRYIAADVSRPLHLGRRFDLAVSAEVGEHLPADSADTFVASLTQLAPVVLFSAAIPFQQGTQHVNEQWPEYWAEHFQNHGYVPVDAIRAQVWQDDRVEWWYAQNVLLYVRREDLPRYPALQQAFERTDPHRLTLVHPRNYIVRQLAVEDYATLLPLRKILAALPIATKRALVRRIHYSRSLLVATPRR